MTFNDFVQKRIKELREGSSFRFQVLERDSDVRDWKSDDLERKFRGVIPLQCRVVSLDLQEYSCFDEFLCAFAEKTYDELGEYVENDRYPKEDALDPMKRRGLRFQFKLMLGRVAKKGARVILIIKRYEEAATCWMGGFGYMRDLLDSSDLRMSAVVFTSKPMSEVSKEPVGSSPLYNIFGSVYELNDVAQTEDDGVAGETYVDRPQDDGCFIGFIGRDNYLRELMKQASSKRPRHLSVFGLPRIGKNRLIDEWVRRIQANNYEPEPSGPKLYVLNRGALDENSSYTTVVNGVLSQIRYDFPDFFDVEGARVSEPTASDSGITDDDRLLTDAEEATLELRKAIKVVNSLHLRVTLILDEFQEIGEEWSEEDYRQFCLLLLDKELDLFCIVISRPHLSYIVNEHIYRIMPFKPLLLKSFSDHDLKEYFRRLHEKRGVDLLNDQFKYERKRLLTDSGKVPHLLDETAKLICENNERPVAFSLVDPRLQNLLNERYEEVARFMREEEDKRLQSFTHIVKCYFGTSDDYDDVIDRYFDLGYVEKVEENDLLADLCKPYARFDDEGRLIGYYTTYCPGFVNYLYAKQLDKIHDVRELFIGLVHSLRRITEKELKEKLEERLVSPPDVNYRWYEHLMNCFIAQENGCNYYAFRNSDDPSNWDICLPHSIKGDNKWIRSRTRWIEDNGDKMFLISYSSLTFAVEALKNGGGGAELLDSISLYDNAEILCHFSDVFAPYFGVLGDLEKDYRARDMLKSCLKGLHYDVRNPLSHYSRKKRPRRVTELHRKLCIELLKSIYGYIASGNRVDSNPDNFRRILSIMGWND